MKIVHTTTEMRTVLAQGPRPAFLATMGNLHEGHLAQVRHAKVSGRPVVVSIFVNRLQFGPNEDFDRYPRTLEADCKLLEAQGCDFVFAPDEHELYPEPQGFKVKPPAELAGILEGQFRPDFFTGVCTVVLKLFNVVQPALTVFGKKDYQQQLIVRAMVRQLGLPIEVVPGDTCRAIDGLALSSRNGYLSPAERTEAAELHRLLRSVAHAARGERRDLDKIERDAMETLRRRGWQPDYVAIRSQSNLLPPADHNEPLVVLAAAKLGRTRLIDSLEIS